MTNFLWAIEALRDGKWILLPNIIMVGRKNAEFELQELRKNPDSHDTGYRLVMYKRLQAAPRAAE